MSYIDNRKVIGLVALDRSGTAANVITYDNTESGLTSTNVQDALDEIKTDIAPVLLWENPTPTVDFAGGYTDLSDSLVNYNRIRIEYLVNKTQGTLSIKEFIPSGGNWANKMWILDVMGIGNVVCRSFQKGTAARLYWEGGYNAISGGTGNDVMIPYRIYGIKEGI